MASVSNNIIRYAGETMPSKSTIEIDGTPLDLSDGWRIEIRYKVPKGTILPNGHGFASDDNTVIVIDGIFTDSRLGKFSIYPHGRLPGDEILTPDKFITSEVREKLIANNNGDETGVPYVNQVWDDNEVEAAGKSLEYPFYVVRIKEYNSSGCTKCYQEEQVHNVGMIQIANRWLA